MLLRGFDKQLNRFTFQFKKKKKKKLNFDIKNKKTIPIQNQIRFILYSVCLDLTYVCENTKI